MSSSHHSHSYFPTGVCRHGLGREAGAEAQARHHRPGQRHPRGAAAVREPRQARLRQVHDDDDNDDNVDDSTGSSPPR